MSIDYYATRSNQREQCLEIVRGTDSSLPLLNRDEVREALLEWVPFLESEGPSGLFQLQWQVESYIQVTIQEHYVTINHGTSVGDRLLKTLEAILETLEGQGLIIFDPQANSFLE